MKGILKWPLIVAAVVVVLRVIVERAGAPTAVSNLLSIVALHTLIGPIYFAVRIGMAGIPRPYLTLTKSVALYAVYTRVLLLPTYWLARIFQWHEPRFGGLTNSPPFIGFIAIPFATAGFWIVASIVVGNLAGAAILAIVRASTKPQLARPQN